MLIFINSLSHIFFKIGVLKNFAIFTGKHWSPWSTSFIEHLWWLVLDFRGSKYFFFAESGIYYWRSHQFLLRTFAQMFSCGIYKIFENTTCFSFTVEIRSFFWSVFSCIRTEYDNLLRNTKIYYLDTFYAVLLYHNLQFRLPILTSLLLILL